MFSDAGELWSRRLRRLLALLESLISLFLYLPCFLFDVYELVLSSAVNGGTGSRRRRCDLRVRSTAILLIICSPPPHLTAVALPTTQWLGPFVAFSADEQSPFQEDLCSSFNSVEVFLYKGLHTSFVRSESVHREATVIQNLSEDFCFLPQPPWSTSARLGSRVNEKILPYILNFQISRAFVPEDPFSAEEPSSVSAGELVVLVPLVNSFRSSLEKLSAAARSYLGLARKEIPQESASIFNTGITITSCNHPIGFGVCSFEGIQRKNMILTLPESDLASSEPNLTRLRSERHRGHGLNLPTTIALLTVSVNPAIKKSGTEVVWQSLTESTIWYDIQFQFNPATIVKPTSLDIKHRHGLKTCSILLMFESYVFLIIWMVKLISSKALVAYAQQCNEQH